MRIDKLVSLASGLSRKEVTSLAKKGAVTVNGVVVKDLSLHVNENADTVTLLGETLTYSEFVYFMLNKPQGYVSATEDGNFPVVTELIPEKYKKRELFPVGRLDKDTVGLMILTNNGKLAHALLSPKRHCEKKYYFECNAPLSDSAIDAFKNGITLRDGYECKSAGLELFQNKKSGVITLTEGKYHQIKRMMGALDNRITYLKRISFADIPLDKDLREGEARPLKKEEIALLENYN